VEVARDLGVAPNVLHRWKQQLETRDPATAFPGHGKRAGLEDEVRGRMGSGCALQARRRMIREGLTTAFDATTPHITEPRVIDPSMLLEHLRRC